MSSPTPANPFEGIELRIIDGIIFGVIILYSLYILVTLPLTPELIGTHPLLLSFIRGSMESILVTGALSHAGKVSLLVAILAPVPVLMVTDPFLYWAGKRLGRPILDSLSGSSPKQIRRREWAERLFRRFGVWCVLFSYFIPFPNTIFYVAAGESGMPFWIFLSADILGTLLWIVLFVALGWTIGTPALAVAKAVSRYAGWVSIGLIAIVLVISFRNARRQIPSSR